MFSPFDRTFFYPLHLFYLSLYCFPCYLQYVIFYACSGDSFEFNNRSVFLPSVVEKSQQTGRKTLWFTEKALGHCQSNKVKVCIENSSKAQDKGAK